MPRRSTGPSEHQIQATFFELVELHKASRPALALLHAIPNGGARHAVVGAKLRAEGVRRGVPDVHLPVARGAFIGLWIEFKRPGERPTDPQRAWFSALRGHGHRVVVCEDPEIAIREVLDYLNEPSSFPRYLQELAESETRKAFAEGVPA